MAVTTSGTAVLDKSMSAIAVGHEDVRTRLCRGVEGEGENEFKSFVSYKLNVSPAKSFEGYAPPETDILRGEPSFRFIPSICEKAQNGCDERRVVRGDRPVARIGSDGETVCSILGEGGRLAGTGKPGIDRGNGEGVTAGVVRE